MARPQRVSLGGGGSKVPATTGPKRSCNREIALMQIFPTRAIAHSARVGGNYSTFQIARDAQSAVHASAAIQAKEMRAMRPYVMATTMLGSETLWFISKLFL